MFERVSESADQKALPYFSFGFQILIKPERDALTHALIRVSRTEAHEE